VLPIPFMKKQHFLIIEEIYMKQVEILAPAASYEGMVGAFNAGADAVYAGGSHFGARAYAVNFTQEDLLKAIEYAHLHGKKLYLTVNTLLKDSEMDRLYPYLMPYYMAGLDAVIVQDVGVLQFIHETFKDLDIHISTQLSVTGKDSALFFKHNGAKRIVSARELQIEEVAAIKAAVDIELETFVHGALCYCYSGQCFLSSIIGGRSGNRGRCAQPCRLPYHLVQNGSTKKDANFYMSLKDICTLDIIPQLVNAGIDSFKIEGRMKSPEYAAFISALYRKYLDLYEEKGSAGYHVEEQDIQNLMSIYNRGGFSDGYYQNYHGKHMLSLSKSTYSTENKDLKEAIKRAYLTEEKQEKIKGSLTVLKGLPVRMQVKYKGLQSSVTGDTVLAARTSPLTATQLKARISKTGNTPFIFEDLRITMDDDTYLPVKALNNLRRESLEILKGRILESFRRSTVTESVLKPGLNERSKPPVLNILTERLELIPIIIKYKEVSGVYIEARAIIQEDMECLKMLKEAGKKLYLAMPFIFRENTKELFLEKLDILKSRWFDGYLIRNIETYQFLSNHDICGEYILDYTVHVFNRRAKAFWLHQKIDSLTASIELNMREYRELGCEASEIIAYGYLPLMVSAQCIMRNTSRCDQIKSRDLNLSDRRYKKFSVVNECEFCYNLIYNSQPLMLIDCLAQINKLWPKSIRLILTREDTEMADKIIKSFINGFIYQKAVNNFMTDFTRGHFKRGVE